MVVICYRLLLSSCVYAHLVGSLVSGGHVVECTMRFILVWKCLNMQCSNVEMICLSVSVSTLSYLFMSSFFTEIAVLLH